MTITADLAEALATVQRPGDFVASGTFPLLPPALEVQGVGPIARPLLPEQARQLVAAGCLPAPPACPHRLAAGAAGGLAAGQRGGLQVCALPRAGTMGIGTWITRRSGGRSRTVCRPSAPRSQRC